MTSTSGRNVLTVRAYNRRVLLQTLLREQPISRVRLARLTGLSTTTVTNLVAALVEQQVLEEVGMDSKAASKGAGRPPLALSLVPDSRFSFGIHIGVRRIKIALCNLQAKISDSRTLTIDPLADARTNLEAACEVARDMAQRHGFAQHDSQLVGVGVGASGLVDVAAGVNLYAPNLNWRNVPVGKIVHSALGLPVAVDNNVRCMALAESLFGAGQQVRALAFIYARIGVGAGLVVDGRIYHGAGYGAGEIGHWIMMTNAPTNAFTNGASSAAARDAANGVIPAIDRASQVTLEALISERVIVERVRELAPHLLDGQPDPIQAVFAAARQGDKAICRLLNQRASFLGLALGNLIDVLNPQLFLLGGILQDGFDLLEPQIAATMRAHAFGGLGDHVALQPATFGAQCGEIGAAVLGLDAFFLGAECVSG